MSKNSKKFVNQGNNINEYSYKDIYWKEQFYKNYNKTEIPDDLLDYVLFNEKYKADLGTDYLYWVEKEIADNIWSEFTERLKSLWYDWTIQSPEWD
jgi:hypothetical protein